MAVLGQTALTLADWAKRRDPEGKIPVIVEMLSQTNALLDDMLWKEGNLPTGNKTTVRTGLPNVAWRRLNYGVQPSKSTTKQVTDETGMLEARSMVDVDLAQLEGNQAEFRLSESRAFMEAMSQEMADTLIYGNSQEEEAEFTGLTLRYSDPAADNAKNIIDAGGTGSDNTSIWLVVWGDQTAFGIFPKASNAGLIHNDKGMQEVSDPEGGRLTVFEDHYQWKAGFTLRDWRYVVRIANIDVSELAAGNVDLINLMIKALHRLPSKGMGRPAFYMNRTVAQFLDIQATNKENVQLGMKEFAGDYVMMFRDVPLRQVDALTNAETAVPFS